MVATAAALLAPTAGLAAAPGAWPGPHVYNDAYTGWPVAPVDQQHPIRASFHDIRPGSFPKGLPGFHIGVDIAVRDDQPEPGAPPGRSHRVYAVEGGTVDLLPNVANVGCVNRRVTAGHFSYWHVDPVGVVERRTGDRARSAHRLDLHDHVARPPVGDPERRGHRRVGQPAAPGRQARAVRRHRAAGHRGRRALRARRPGVAARRHGPLVARRRQPPRSGAPQRARRPARHRPRSAVVQRLVRRAALPGGRPASLSRAGAARPDGRRRRRARPGCLPGRHVPRPAVRLALRPRRAPEPAGAAVPRHAARAVQRHHAVPPLRDRGLAVPRHDDPAQRPVRAGPDGVGHAGQREPDHDPRA